MFGEDLDRTVLKPPDGKPLSAIVVVDTRATKHALPTTGEVQLGRIARGGIPIDHSTISRLHAVIRMDPTLTIEDLGSVNGTFVREQRISPGKRIPIEIGDLIRIGDVFVILTTLVQGAAK